MNHPAEMSFFVILIAACGLSSCSILLTAWSIPSASVRTVEATPLSPSVVITPSSLPQRYELTHLPRTVDELLVVLDPTRFEFFATAVIVALGEGYRFHEHRGKSGDRGIDTIVLNLYFKQVGVQCKLYGSTHAVGGPELRAFWDALRQQACVYGFFVTTSTFTAEARQVVKDAGPGTIRVIDVSRLN